MFFYDTETCGLHGVPVTIQYGTTHDDVVLHEIWTSPMLRTVKIIEMLMSGDLCGFNKAYDMFHLNKIYGMFKYIMSLSIDGAFDDVLPIDIIDELALAEKESRGMWCVKPKRSLDLMLVARKGEYQKTMAHKSIKIRRIPIQIAEEVADTLEELVKIDDIMFSRSKSDKRWRIAPRKDTKDFVDIVLSFKPSSALKVLAVHALKRDPEEIALYDKIKPPGKPWEAGYAPFALAFTNKEKRWWCDGIKAGDNGGIAWPGHIRNHVYHWTTHEEARDYAKQDVHLLIDLYEHFKNPEPGDIDSELASMVGAVRWAGFEVNIDKANELIKKYERLRQTVPMASHVVKVYLGEVMNELEKLTINDSTKKTVLEDIATWESDDPDPDRPGCYLPHPAAIRARAVLDARQAKHRIDTLSKLVTAGRFHASFEVIGALSSRMSGRGGDFNPQGIARLAEMREVFVMANKNEKLSGGDFDSFEVVITIAWCKDEKLEAAVRSGKKVHALFGLHVYPHMTYEQIMNDKEKYTRSKSAVFALIYGGVAYTLRIRLGVSQEDAEAAYASFIGEYTGVGAARKSVFDSFCTMRQVGGIGSKVIWEEPKPYMESMLGFRRYFTVENNVARTLFELSNNPPKHWKEIKGHCFRRDREQTFVGACRSALIGAAFAIQGSNARAACNHVIQSSGATITKTVQAKLWELQPSGCEEWRIKLLNSHDELLTVTNNKFPETETKAEQVVSSSIESFRPVVPLIKMDWKKGLKNWSEKG